MSTGVRLAGLLLLTTALTCPGVTLAQDPGAPPGTGPEGLPATEEPAATAGDDQPGPDTPAEDTQAEVPPVEGAPADPDAADVSVPGGAIVVTGQRRRDVQRASTQVVNVLSAEAIARTGEGDIAGALSRVTGLSTVGNGLVYVRGLGDRYSLALLNGLPLPSPEPLSRVVPLDIFPTDVIASSLVQKTYSPNFPGEFGGGVINLTTLSVPRESFLKISAGISGDEQTTFSKGNVYYGGDFDWTGFDDGSRDPTPALASFLNGSARVNEAGVDRQAILKELGDPNFVLLQGVDALPVNWSAGLTGGTSADVFSDGRLGMIATISLSNKYRNRRIVSQTPVGGNLALRTDDVAFVTDNRVVFNALLGFGLEVGEHNFRFTNLFIRDTLKRAALEQSEDVFDGDTSLIQDTAWYERQLYDTQLVGELEFDPFSIDLRAGFAQTRREAPYEWEFVYNRSNQANDPFGQLFINRLDEQRGSATVAFSELEENLYYGGIDLTYRASDWLSATLGYAYTDTRRDASRRQLSLRATSGFPVAFGLFRPDALLGDQLIDLGFDPARQAAAGIGPYTYSIFETTETDPAFRADLDIHAGYGMVRITPGDLGLTVDLGVRYEDAVQTVVPVQVFTTPSNSGASTSLENDYFLPAATVTFEVSDDLQLRASASKTIARPQFRELIFQTYFDPENNRQFNGNPSLVDSELTNFEARAEYYLNRANRVSLAGFYKDIKNPIEVFSSFSQNEQVSSFANAPSAKLYGAELEMEASEDLADWGGWWANKRIVAVLNYTYTQSELEVAPGDTTRIFRGGDLDPTRPASEVFVDGVPLTGQSDHLANFQISLENQDVLQQFTLLASYASERVTSRGFLDLPDIFEDPGLRIDLVYRQGLTLAGVPLELKLEARNLTGRDNFEYQDNGVRRIDINSYEVGRSFSASLSAEF
jgi:outer membrane receptor protein involved in Fe transport